MIQVGQVLDKYELLERVGQGGMAVVYRGLDRSLKRVVAVKILHKHLSDYQEARDRFEREAQAVAKLRHENILEIFDYSGSQEAEDAGGSYIVTEFIDGATLKQAITDRPIAFPEIGAMIVLQVARALAHAHSLKILHRDVKPENIMIRSDGVVKLMDFGISHMVDLERLTVTGQLLGSPAYMAPEHVEGKPIDFRTDVFAVGIVLYQLTTGKLPFEGKNPHEVLKRIAECKFTDPRQVNPRIGNRLGRIILRAMAAEPDDRYPAIGEMVTALEAYLEESGLAPDKVASELGRYFQAPGAYESALQVRLVDTLTKHGQKLLAEDNKAGALDAFDRVLTIEPTNEKVVAILDGINRRTKYKQWAIGGGLAIAIAVGAFLVHRRTPTRVVAPPVDAAVAIVEVDAAPAEPIPSVVVDAAPPDAPTQVAVGSGSDDDPRPTRPVNGGTDPRPVTPPVDAAVAVVAQPLKISVRPSRNAEIRVGDGGWLPVDDASGSFETMIDGDVSVSVRSPCCGEEAQTAKLGQSELVFMLSLKPGAIIAKCDIPDTSVVINKKSWQLDQKFDVIFGRTTSEELKVTVEFLVPNAPTITKTVKVGSGKPAVEVSCK